ncbi:hypothetical protein ACOKM5_40745 [Streptomyces sp. BH097]|uniref:hypothetical protein n=1 Tax=unclassified Streptomyces TaxID=2593676 RepID=UPI003BB4A463
MKKHLKKIGVTPGGAAVGFGGGGGSLLGERGGAPMAWWLCAVLGVVLALTIVYIVKGIRDVDRMSDLNR